jgi:hypothetical protein
LLDNFPVPDAKKSFRRACLCGRLDLVKKLLPSSKATIHKGFITACQWGLENIAAFLSGHCTVDWNEALLAACDSYDEERPTNTIQLCVDNGATNLEAALEKAMKEGDKTVAHYLVDAGIPHRQGVQRSCFAASARP